MTVLFQPTPWLRHRHLQTLMPTIAGPLLGRAQPTLVTELAELPDGDAVEWLRTGDPAGRPAVLLLPGLEGSIASPYAPLLLATWAARGWCGAILHHRGAACRPNRLVRGCHSGDWSDAAHVVEILRARGATRVAAVGVSLGGNMLMNWVGETGASCPLATAIGISVPYDLDACARALDAGFARVYRRHLLGEMHASMLAKRHLNGFTPAWLESLRTFHAFDDAITAPQNGFAGVADYYARCSSGRRVGGIRIPTTLLHAADDPFVPQASVPSDLPASVILRLSAHGGHVGFLSGWRPRPWLPSATCNALEPFLGISNVSGANRSAQP